MNHITAEELSQASLTVPVANVVSEDAAMDLDALEAERIEEESVYEGNEDSTRAERKKKKRKYYLFDFCLAFICVALILLLGPALLD
eukprot:snap_masked-scaffold_38-processed-gene-2.44-mRNA-1 protein AED:0.19 eAED:1.00 QI:0/-1/0/1/-1/1/1/0/86